MGVYDKFKVAILPLAIVDGDKEANIAAVTHKLEALPEGVDLLVLPELFSTGYIGDKEVSDALAETTSGPTIEAVKALARRHKIAISGSFISRDCEDAGADVYNRGFIIEPGGEATYYDKRHLFVLGQEPRIYTHGADEPSVVRYRGWNLMMCICYDVRFPVWLRNVGNMYDALIVPANWPDRRGKSWTRLLQARAIENMSYVVGANRSGEDQFGSYDGLSAVYDALGDPVSSASGDFITATLDKGLLNQLREKFPAWKDADEFRIL